jgi:hypothetical protein
MGHGLAITIPIGGDEVAGWLPLLPTRFRLEAAYRRALGWTDDDDEKPTGNASEQDFGAVLAAFVGVCWGGEPLELARHTSSGVELVLVPPSPAAVRAFDRDLLELGEAALDALVGRGYRPGDVFEAGRRVRELVVGSIVLQSEVEAEAGNSEAPAGAYIEPMSSSA